MLCHHCGHYNLKAAVFCSNCGQKLDKGESVTQMHPSPLTLASTDKDSQNLNHIEHQSSATTKYTNSADRWFAAFVGQKYYSFYRNKWFKSRSPTLNDNHKPLSIISFNLAALIFSVSWLFYRKMYKEALVVLIAVSLFDLGFMHLLGMDAYDRMSEYTLWIAEMIFLGFLGNLLYFRHTAKKIKQAKSLLSDTTVIEQRLIEQGGTTWIGAFYGVVLEMIIPYAMYYLLAPIWFW